MEFVVWDTTMKQHPTAEEFNSLSDAALARYFRWAAAHGPLMEADPFKRQVQPHIREMVEFLKDLDPDWIDVFVAIPKA
jgi:hypothetical protein